MRLFYFFLIACSWAKLENFEFYGKGGITYFACAYYLSGWIFCDYAGDYGCFCSNDNARATMMGCFEEFGTSVTAAEKYMSNYCSEYYAETVTTAEYEESYSYYLSNATDPYTANPDFNVTVDVVTSPVLIDSTTATLYRDAYVAFLGNYDLSIWLGIGAFSYWLVVCLVAAIANWSVILFPKLRSVFNGKVSRLWRRYVTMPALWTRKRSTQQDFLGGLLSFLIPSRLESILIFIYFWIVFAFLVVEIKYVPDDPIFGAKNYAITRYVADRTGIIATMTVPLLILFGGRNNILQWITRWKFSSFITYHRWIARLMVAMAFSHGICFTINFKIGDYYYSEFKDTYVIWGIVAIVCGSFICFQGLLFLRRAYYETFLVIHILLAVFFVVGLWFHISVLEYPQLVYPIFAVWGVDRLVRVVRILWFGFPSAKVELLADDAIKVSVPKPKAWRSIPGGHAWIHFGLGWYFWQSHPFTFIEFESENGPQIVFYCKMKNGVTSKLSKKLANIPGRTLSMRVAIEGPYGETSPVQRHSNVTYVAGGNGIPGIFAEAFSLTKTVAKRSSKSPTLKLVWIIREMKSLGWFYNELQLLKDLPVEAVLYITRPEMEGSLDNLQNVLRSGAEEDKSQSIENSNKSESGLEDDAKKEKCNSSELIQEIRDSLPHVAIFEGRPDLHELVRNDIEASTESCAFVTCGHPSMVDDLRLCVLQNMENTSKRVDFYDQLQVWA